MQKFQKIAFILMFLLFSGYVFCGEPVLAPWNENKPFPRPSEIAFPKGTVHYIVQDCDQDPDYRFLHETAVGFLGNKIIAAWYNNPTKELTGKTFQRYRWSEDEGKTWSNPQILMDRGNDKGLMYVGMQFLNLDGELYAFTNEEHGAEKPFNMNLLRYEKSNGTWKELGPIAARFLSMQQPILMDNGNYAICGSYNPTPGGVNGYLPAVYISQGKDIAKPWKRYLIDTEYVNVFAETAMIAEGASLFAMTRLERSAYPNVYISKDYGKIWEKIENTSFPASSTKFAAGTLSNGTRYLLFNIPDFKRDQNGKIIPNSFTRNRGTLAIALAKPDEKAFSKIWKVSDSSSSTKQRASHYPCAVEHNGKLYITYTGQHKYRNCGLTIIPIDSLK
ncbi:MAG: exo-alpha-sialidase [Planctomycetia bacterium]|nr:exo-alpha-sialidase [Planctomycetia bacterium]